MEIETPIAEQAVLFDLPEKRQLVSLGDIDNLQGLPPNLWVWFRELYFAREQPLEKLAEILVSSGRISSGSEVPAFLQEALAGEPRGRHFKSFGDLQRLAHRGLEKFVRNFSGSETDDNAKPVLAYQSLGRVSHQFADWLYRGPVRIGKPPAAGSTIPEQVRLFPDYDHGSKIRGNNFREKQPSLPGLEMFRSSARNPGWLDPELLGNFRDSALGAQLISTLSPADFVSQHLDNERRIGRLWESAWALFPEQVRLCAANTGPLSEYLNVLTLISWLGVLNRRLGQDAEQLSLTEIPVLPASFEVQAGRIDRLDLLYEGPRRAAVRPHPGAFRSALEFAEKILRFPGHPRLRVVDWKFAVGDNRDKLIGKTQELPMYGHIDQIQWYVLWLALGHALASGNGGHIDGNGNFAGQLLYVFTDGEIREVNIEPAPEELKRRFEEQVVWHWDRIAGHTNHRLFSNQTIAAIRREFNGGNGNGNGNHGSSNGNGHTTKTGSEEPGQLTLPNVHTGQFHPIADLVESHRKFIGRGDVIEESRDREGISRLRLNLERLICAAKTGTITLSSRFDWEDRGGFITCPIHEEKTPSCNINLSQGFFKCFGCGAKGALVAYPPHLSHLASPEAAGRRAARKSVELFEISDEIRGTLALAQRLFAESFRGSEAFDYLTQQRKIPAVLAREYGAGAGSHPRLGLHALRGLLDSGIKPEALYAAGLINYSERAKPNGPVPTMFRRFGIPAGNIARRRRLRMSDREVFEWPFFPLAGRLIFPLELPIGGRPVTVGFYGRLVPNEWNQRKKDPLKHLIVQATGTPKGMFNWRGLAADMADGGLYSVYVTEGVIDALVLNGLGQCPAVAIIGTRNDHLEKLLVGLNPRTINIALDFDEPGVAATKKMAESFGKYGFPAERIEDHAIEFIAGHPEVSRHGYDDLGTWWQEYGHRDR